VSVGKEKQSCLIIVSISRASVMRQWVIQLSLLPKLKELPMDWPSNRGHHGTGGERMLSEKLLSEILAEVDTEAGLIKLLPATEQAGFYSWCPWPIIGLAIL
jgi:hypothetical protein